MNRCLYCNSLIRKESLVSFFLEDDPLCLDCRRKMFRKRKIIIKDDMKVETFYEYDSLYKSLLIQFKECYDEALKDVFLYGLADYISLRYRGYTLMFIPSSGKKRKERGFDHLELMFENVRLKRASGLKMKREMIQEGKSAQDRQNMANNYVYEGERLSRVLIVDDVMTTGSSLKGAYEVMKKNARRVKVLSLAYKSKNIH